MDLLDERPELPNNSCRISWNVFSVAWLSLEIDVFWNFKCVVNLAKEIKKCFFLFYSNFESLRWEYFLPHNGDARNGISAQCFASLDVEGIPWIIHSIFWGNLFQLSASVTFSLRASKFVSHSKKEDVYIFFLLVNAEGVGVWGAEKNPPFKNGE